VVPKLSGLLPAIEAQVSNRPDATIAELRAWLLETHKVSASTGLINKTLAALDLTFIDPALTDLNVRPAFTGLNWAFPRPGIQDNEGRHYKKVPPRGRASA
jgi:hypothetical protein